MILLLNMSRVLYSQDHGTHGEKVFKKIVPDTTTQTRIYRSNIPQPQNLADFLTPQNNKIDNKGTEFWVCFQQNYNNTEHPLALSFFITSEFNTNVTINIPGINWQQSFSILKNKITTIKLPSPLNIVVNGEGRFIKGIHIVAEEEVTVYGLNQMEFTTDAYLALPVDILNVFYFVMSYTSISDDKNQSQFAIVSPYDDVTVTITPSVNTEGGRRANVPFSVVLNRGDVYQVQAYKDYDLTGSVIQSTLPVSVFGGNSCAYVPLGYGYCDHLVEQLPPLNTWGSSFVTFPLKGRENGDSFRMLASQNGTVLKINGFKVTTLNFGDYYETVLKNSVQITSTNPILVMQYSNGNDYDPNIASNGDPFMMLIPPTEQFMPFYTFSTPGSGFPTNYVSITIPSSGISSLWLDGKQINSTLFKQISNTDYYGAGIYIEIGSHTIENKNGIPFGIYSYGFWDDDSYGYAGGLSLEYIYQGSAPVIARTSETINLSKNAQVANQPLTISAKITDSEEPFTQSAALFYRQVNKTNFSRISMTRGANDIWSAQIPAAEIQDPGISYYLHASDGQMSSTDPTVNAANNPYSIAVLPNNPPIITHTPLKSARSNINLEISATITDKTQWITSAKLFYRIPGGNPVYTELKMNLSNNDIYKAIIPARDVTDQNLEYYLQATDNYGVSASNGTADSPHFITIAANVPVNFILLDASEQANRIANRNDFIIYLYDNQHQEIDKIQNISTNSQGVLQNFVSQKWDNAEYIRVEKIVHREEARKAHHEALDNELIIVYLDTDTFDEEGHIHHVQIDKSKAEQELIMLHTTFGFNLLIAVEWDADDDYLKNLLEGMAYTSNYLYDVFDGQVFINKVAIYDNAKFRDNGYYWKDTDIRIYASNIHPTIENPQFGPWTNPGGFYENNSYIHMPRFIQLKLQKGSGWNESENRNYTFSKFPYDWREYHENSSIYVPYRAFAHELGHYIFGFLDEYCDGTEEKNKIFKNYNFGMMDSPADPDFNASEISSMLIYENHQSPMTWQLSERKKPCWEWFDFAFHEYFPEINNPIYCPILTPTERVDKKSLIPGPNNNFENYPNNLDNNIGTFLYDDPISNMQNNTFVYEYKFIFAGIGIGKIEVFLFNENINNLKAIYQGQTANNGGIKVLGANIGDQIIAYGKDWSRKQYSDFFIIPSPLAINKSIRSGNPRICSENSVINGLFSIFKENDKLFLNYWCQTKFKKNPLVKKIYYDKIDSKELTYDDFTKRYWTQFNYDPNETEATFLFCIYDDSLKPFYVWNDMKMYTIESETANFNIISPDGKMELNINKTSIKKGDHFIVFPQFMLPIMPKNPNKINAGNVYSISSNITAFSGENNNLTIYYADSDLDSLYSENDLKVHKWNYDKWDWDEIGGSVDTSSNVVHCAIKEPGIYGLFTVLSTPGTSGSLKSENIYNYPNPFNPNLQWTTLRYSLAQDAQVSIKIYDAAGQLVKVVIENLAQLANQEYGEIWDGKNENGDVVANGVYFYIIESSAGEKAISKIAVLK